MTILALVLAATVSAWDHWGGDAGGQRYAAPDAITPQTVDELIEAWSFSTGDIEKRPEKAVKRSKKETTPILVEGNLVFCSTYNEVIALDPATGTQRWRFDPKISTEQRPANRYNCRGVTPWRDDQAAADAPCASRILMGTNDYRLIAIDAKNGQRCTGFGTNGEVQINPGMALEWPGEFQITSPPAIGRGVVVVGSAISDNQRVDAPLGVVRAFDVRTGQPRWQFDPLDHSKVRAGHANVWAPMSVDETRGLIFLPTSSPSVDFFGGLRPGDNRDANSVVALNIETGARVWGFQIVHHDVWDYDTPAQPTLATLNLDGGPRDVVIQGTKQGFVFVLDRETGEPIWPVEERPVPQGGVEGEQLSPTQPFPTHVPALVPQHLDVENDAWAPMSFLGEDECRAIFRGARYEGLYTPPSEQGTLLFPMTGGGINWGGVAFDPIRQVLYANTSRAVHLIRLYKTADLEKLEDVPGREIAEQAGAPYGMTRNVVMSPIGTPCNRPPWGKTVAVDLRAGKILWEQTVGTTEDRAPLGLAINSGTPLVNGVLVTGGGLLFTGAGDAYLRALDASTGEELWQGRLPAPGMANPMSYGWQGEQYVVVAAGGHSEAGTSLGDSIVAFRLPRDGEGGPSLWSRTIDRPGGRFWATIIGGGVLAFSLIWMVWRALRGRRRRRPRGT